MVSKIERGEASPTAALLGRLAAAFGLTMSGMFAEMEEQPGALVARADQQPVGAIRRPGFSAAR